MKSATNGKPSVNTGKKIIDSEITKMEWQCFPGDNNRTAIMMAFGSLNGLLFL